MKALHRHRDDARVEYALTFMNYDVIVVDRVGRIADETRSTRGRLVSVCTSPTWGAASLIVLRTDESGIDKSFSLATVISIEVAS